MLPLLYLVFWLPVSFTSSHSLLPLFKYIAQSTIDILFLVFILSTHSSSVFNIMIIALSSLFYILFPPIIIILSDYHNKIPECVIYKQQKLAHYREVQWRIKTTASSVCHETLSIDEAFSLPSYCRSLIPFRGAPSS